LLCGCRLYRGALHRRNLRAVHLDPNGDSDGNLHKYADRDPDRNPGAADAHAHRDPDRDQYADVGFDSGTEQDLVFVYPGWGDRVLFLLGAARAVGGATELDL
jgi:hypothetical protein